MTSVAEFTMSASHKKKKKGFFTGYVDYIIMLDLLFTYGMA